MAAEVIGKKGKNRKALRILTANDANISVAKNSSTDVAKENCDVVSVLISPEKSKKNLVPKEKSLSLQLEELRGWIKQLNLEKEKIEELLKQRDEVLKQKDEEQQKLQEELKRLKKMKEFNPILTLPMVKYLREKEQNDKENKKKKKKKKKRKNCLEKKNPSPAYVMWCKDQWNEVKKDQPEANFKEISSILGSKWKNLSADEKKPYEQKYQQEKEAYLQIVGKEKRESEAMKLLEEEQMQKTAMELLEQYLHFRQDTNKEGKKMKKERDPFKPKQPMSAFFLYLNERRAPLLEEKKNVVEVAKIAGEEWKNMREEQRAPYEERAKKQREECNREMELYKKKKAEEAEKLEKEANWHMKVLKQEALQLLKKKEKTENLIKESREMKNKSKAEQKRDPDKPKKPASSFLLFSREERKKLSQERPGTANSTMNALISVKWKELSEAEKQVWNERTAEKMAAYTREIDEYNKLAAAATSISSSC